VERRDMMDARAARALAFGIGVGVIFSVLALSPIGAALEEAVSLPWLFRMRGAIEPPSDVVIVAIDKRSADHLGLAPHPRDWPRSKHAELIQQLRARGAASIVFDLKFEKPRSPIDDDEFAEAMREFGRVFLVKGRDRQDKPEIGSIGPPIIDVPLQRNLEEAALGAAPFPIPRVESRRVNQVWAFHADDATLPALALHAGVQDRWLELLQASGLSIGASALDAKRTPLTSELTHAMRFAFKHNPTFVQTVHRRFEQEFKVGSGNVPIGTSASLEALIRLYEGPDNIYLNFYGPPGTVPTVSYYQVLSGDSAVSSIDFRKKTVFVGVSELGKPVKEDSFPTVFGRDDGVDLSGVEIAATAFANLLTDQALQPAGPGLSASILFALGIVITVCSLTMPAGFALVIAAAIGAGYALGAQTAFNREATWVPLATPLLLQIPTALVLGFASQNAFVRRQRRRVQRALGHYVPTKVAKTFADSGVEPTTLRETVYATCLAADAEGFTAVAEGMTPESAASFLNAYFEALAEPLRRHGADLTQFHADSIMCAWTGPRPDPAVRSKACLAAAEALDAVRAFNERHAPLHLGVRLGLHTGRVFVGNAGVSGHFIYGIVGDIANTASRIEQLNKILGTRLLATEEVVSGLDDILVRPLGEFLLAGKRSAVSVFEILCAVEYASMAQLSLCARFQSAIDAFREERWEEAELNFGEILRDYPDDGPAAFYLDQRIAQARGATALVSG
jgi:adenylate cyclase